MAKETSGPQAGHTSNTTSAANAGNNTKNGRPIVEDRGAKILEEYGYDAKEIDAGHFSKQFASEPDIKLYRPDTVD